MVSTEGDGGRILVVDNDPDARRAAAEMIDDAGYSADFASDARQARTLLADGDFAVMLCAVELAGTSGLALASEVRRERPDLAVLMTSTEDDPDIAAAALELGAYGYLMKPLRRNEVVITLANAERRRALEQSQRAHRELLERIVRERTTALERSARQLKLTREETFRRLARAVEYRDEETGAHTERMSQYCGLMAQRLNLDAESIRMASALHDVGKVAVPDEVLLKPGRLTPEERAEMELHSTVGHRILSNSGSDLLELAAQVALTHHEKWDGTGYPAGLSRTQIPLPGRIAAVADVFDALTSERHYRAAFPIEEAVEMMREERGKHFDPAVLDIFLGGLDQVLAIRERYPDPVDGAEELELPTLSAIADLTVDPA